MVETTAGDAYSNSDVECIFCGRRVTRRGKVTISDDKQFIRIRFYCRSLGCGKQFDAVYRFLTMDEPEERKYGKL